MQFDNPEQIFEILDEHLVVEGDQPRHEMVKFEEINEKWLEEQASKYERGEFKTTGHPISNEALAYAFDGSFLHGSLVIWTGTTNIGKSLLCTMLCDLQGLQNGIPTLVLDNELTDKEFRGRLLARMAKTPFRAILRGEAYDRNSEHYEKLRTALPLLKKAPVEWRKMEEISIERIEPVLRKFLRQYKDYPHKQLIIDGIKMSADSDSYLQVGFFAQRLKTHIASRYAEQGLVVHATAQLNRSGGSYAIKKNKDEHPTHENIALSKLIADNADTVCILAPVLDADGQFNKEARKVFITKARNHGVLVGNEYLVLECRGGTCTLNPTGVITNHGLIGDSPLEPKVEEVLQEKAEPGGSI
ncbi:MAG: hypothetical protein MZW92_31350 [Comamonadaceae bacterium]|nr:hypothetical protein [Comamonadaceae bacterium]